jgi:hypothetical protein
MSSAGTLLSTVGQKQTHISYYLTNSCSFGNDFSRNLIQLITIKPEIQSQTFQTWHANTIDHLYFSSYVLECNFDWNEIHQHIFRKLYLNSKTLTNYKIFDKLISFFSFFFFNICVILFKICECVILGLNAFFPEFIFL